VVTVYIVKKYTRTLTFENVSQASLDSVGLSTREQLMKAMSRL